MGSLRQRAGELLQKISRQANWDRDVQTRKERQEDLRNLHDWLQIKLRKEIGDEIRYESGLIKDMLLRGQVPEKLTDVGYRVYSQFDEDGIIEYLVRNVPIENKLFVEFGVEDFRESNTRYLLQKDPAWKGVVLDAVDDALDFLHDSGLYYWREITHIESFITRENINDLLRPFGPDIGLISIDIDGVDYWIWEALESVSARIVIAEYQINFGPDRAITVPYRPDFQRTQHHYSNLCAGASLTALTELGKRKGYTLVGTSAGHNAFFVRNDVLGTLKAVAPADAYQHLLYRDSRDRDFKPTYVSGLENKQRAMSDAVVVDLEDGREKTVAEAFGL